MANNHGMTDRQDPVSATEKVRFASDRAEADFLNWIGRAYGRRDFTLVESALLRGAFAGGRGVGFSAGIQARDHQGSATGSS